MGEVRQVNEAPRMVGDDPWRHRAARMICASCIYFVPKAEPSFGRCRRHAPTISGFPAVFDSDWCGDHKLDENKI